MVGYEDMEMGESFCESGSCELGARKEVVHKFEWSARAMPSTLLDCVVAEKLVHRRIRTH